MAAQWVVDPLAADRYRPVAQHIASTDSAIDATSRWSHIVPVHDHEFDWLIGILEGLPEW